MKKSYFVLNLILWIFGLSLLAYYAYYINGFSVLGLESTSYLLKFGFIFGFLFYSVFDFIVSTSVLIFEKIKNKKNSKFSKESEV